MTKAIYNMLNKLTWEIFINLEVLLITQVNYTLLFYYKANLMKYHKHVFNFNLLQNVPS